MDQQIQACSADPVPRELTPASTNDEGDHTGYCLKTETGGGDATTDESQVDSTVEVLSSFEVARLRSLFLEKLTVKQLRHLINTVEESNSSGPSIKILNSDEFKEPIRRMKRRGKLPRAVDAARSYRASPLPNDRRYALALLSISNFAIETPVAASRLINCIKVCGGTARILYDTNFLLEEDWCSCVISVHFNQIAAISCAHLEVILDLNQPAIVEAGYRNGESTVLSGPNIEIENGLRHRLVMRCPNDMVGFKTALMTADPSLVNRFLNAKFSHDPEMPQSHERQLQQPAIPPVMPAPFSQQMNALASNGTSQYMVPRLCPNSYGQIGSGNLFNHNPGYPRMQYDLTQFSHVPLTFKHPNGTNGRQICTKLEPIDIPGGVDPVNSMYTHEGLFRESQYATAQPEPSPAANSQYYVQSMQSNSDYFIESTTAWLDDPSVTTLAQDRHNCPPRQSLLEMPVLSSVGDTSLEQGSRGGEGGHHWGAGASHLGYFDTPSS